MMFLWVAADKICSSFQVDLSYRLEEYYYAILKPNLHS